MFKIAYQLLKKRIVFVLLIILVLCISFTSLIVTNKMMSGILSYKKEMANSRYGNYTVMATQVSDDDKNLLLHKLNPESIGEIILLGLFKLDRDYFTVGHMDQTALQMTNIQLKEGHLPTRENQIAVEEFILKELEISNDIGSSLRFDINGKVVEFELSGILYNYSNAMNVPANLVKGVNNFPNIICHKNNVFRNGSESNLTMLINVPNSRTYNGNYDWSKIINFVYESEINIENVTYNNHLITKGMTMYDSYYFSCILFSLFILIISLVCCYSMFFVFYRRYVKKLSTLIVCGATINFAIKTVMTQIVSIILIALFISFLLSKHFLDQLNEFFNQYFIEKNKINIESFLSLESLLWLLSLGLFLFISIYYMFVKIKVNSVAANLKYSSSLFSEKKQNSNKNIKTIVSLTIMFTGIICSVFISYILYNDIKYSFLDGPDYVIYSREAMQTEIIDGYEILDNADNYLQFEEINKFEKFQNMCFLDKYPYCNGYTILANQGQYSDYFKNWSDKYKLENTTYEKSTIKSNWPIGANSFIPIPNVQFIIADNYLLEAISTSYFLKINMNDFQNKNQVILFLPNEDSEQKNSSIENGDLLTIGGIKKDENNIVFEHTEFEIAEIVPQNYQIQINEHYQQRDGIVVVLSEEIAKKSGVFCGYFGMNILLNDNISIDSKNQIEQLIQSTANKLQGSLIQTKENVKKDHNMHTQFLHLLSNFSIIITILFGVVFVIMSIYTLFIQYKKTFGIYRALGENLNNIKNKIMSQYFISLGSALIISLFICYNISGDWVYFLSYFYYYIFAVATCSILCIVSIFSTNLLLRNKSVAEMLKNNDT